MPKATIIVTGDLADQIAQLIASALDDEGTIINNDGAEVENFNYTILDNRLEVEWEDPEPEEEEEEEEEGSSDE